MEQKTLPSNPVNVQLKWEHHILNACITILTRRTSTVHVLFFSYPETENLSA